MRFLVYSPLKNVFFHSNDMPSMDEENQTSVSRTTKRILDAALAFNESLVNLLVMKAVKEGQIRSLKWGKRVNQNQIEREMRQLAIIEEDIADIERNGEANMNLGIAS